MKEDEGSCCDRSVGGFRRGFRGLEVVKGVEPFSHDFALVPLNCDLVLGEGSEQNEQADGVAHSPVGPDLWNTSPHFVSEVILLDVEQVSCCSSQGENCAAFEDAL